MGSTTKIGWISAPLAVLDKLSTARQDLDLTLSIFPQVLAKDALSDASFPDKIKELRQQIRDRHAYFFDKIGDSLSSRRPLGGFYVWVRLNPEKNLTKQLDQLMAAGILCLPSFIFGDKTPAIRLNIARLPFSEIDDLVETLRQIIV